MAANASTAIAESGITYIRRFISSPPKYASNFSTNCNKTQKVGKASKDPGLHQLELSAETLDPVQEQHPPLIVHQLIPVAVFGFAE